VSVASSRQALLLGLYELTAAVPTENGYQELGEAPSLTSQKTYSDFKTMSRDQKAEFFIECKEAFETIDGVKAGVTRGGQTFLGEKRPYLVLTCRDCAGLAGVLDAALIAGACNRKFKALFEDGNTRPKYLMSGSHLQVKTINPATGVLEIRMVSLHQELSNVRTIMRGTSGNSGRPAPPPREAPARAQKTAKASRKAPKRKTQKGTHVACRLSHCAVRTSESPIMSRRLRRRHVGHVSVTHQS